MFCPEMFFSVNEFVKSSMSGTCSAEMWKDHPRAGWDFACAASRLYTWECACSVCCYSCSCMLASESNFGLGYWNFKKKKIEMDIAATKPSTNSNLGWNSLLKKMRERINFLWPAKGTVPLKVDLLHKLTVWTCYNLHCCHPFAQNSGSTVWDAAE